MANWLRDRLEAGAAAPPIDIDKLLSRLLEVRKTRAPMVEINPNEILFLIDEATQIFEQQPILLELNPPLNICGDVHGQFHDLLRILHQGQHPPASNYLFLGDYVDRGRNSIEVLCLLLIYKIRFPGNVFLLRGNHETLRINAIYGFLSECRVRYSLEVYHKFNELFAWLPLAAIVGDKIFCCHGGISPKMSLIDDIRDIRRPLRDVPEDTIACDLLWADPFEGRGFAPNDRGVSHVFGADALQRFLDDNGLDLVCRAHQVVADGYEFFANRSLVTLFSAPNYCNEFDNAAAMMIVSPDLTCTFRVLRPTTKALKPAKNNVPQILTDSAELGNPFRADRTKTELWKENPMNSLDQNCNDLKKRYEECFNAWFSDGFLKGDLRDPCKEIFQNYTGCVKKAVEEHKINLWEIEADILGTEKERQPPSSEKK
ncbi:serine/threonine-protein phosphatase alpha-2 isoform-like [Galendromus occidentalis]|uniref:Serine/threonine-protein phosphatase n=1 Tax=Galendromus occidentalis TaxID=34638 RepID=A0AAJ6VV86_9ACAR|nr:serine/threonine-protein phosphatase alpha-2 isoform-like [Galendromus occidentalis]